MKPVNGFAMNPKLYKVILQTIWVSNNAVMYVIEAK